MGDKKTAVARAALQGGKRGRDSIKSETRRNKEETARDPRKARVGSLCGI